MMILLIIISIFVVFNRFGLVFAKLIGNQTTTSGYYIYTVYPVLYRPDLKLSYTWTGGTCKWFYRGHKIASRHVHILNDTDQLNNEPRNRSELLLNWVEGTNRFATIRRSRIRIFVMNCTFYKWRSRQFRTGKYLIQYPVILANNLREANALLTSSASLSHFCPLKSNCMVGKVSFTADVLDGYQNAKHDAELYSCLTRKANFLGWNEVLIMASTGKGELQCDFAGKPTPVVEFQRNGINLNVSSNHLRWNDSRSAWWRCVARNTQRSQEIYLLRLVHPTMSNVTVSSVSSVQKNHTSRLYCVTRGIRQPLVVWLQSWNDRLLFRKIGRSRELDTSRYFLTAETSPMYQRNHKFWCIACTLKAPTGRCVIQSFGVRIDPNFRPEDNAFEFPSRSTGRNRQTTSQSVLPSVYGNVKKVQYGVTRYYWILFILFFIFFIFVCSVVSGINRCRWYFRCRYFQNLHLNRNGASNHNNVVVKPPTPARAQAVPIRSITGQIPSRTTQPPLPWPVVKQPGRIRRFQSPTPRINQHNSQPTHRLTYAAIAQQDQMDPYEMEQNWQINHNRIVYLQELGHGAFGRVFLARMDAGLSHERKVAVKTVRDVASFDGTTSSLSINSSISQIIEEVELMKSLGHHENVINFIGYSVGHSSKPLLIMEYCSHGNLLNFLRGRARRYYDNVPVNQIVLSRAEALLLKSFAYQVAQGMKFLSDKNFIHRDLAARNVLLNERLICKVSDFGLSRKLPGNEQYYILSTGKFPWKWMAPEILSRTCQPYYSTKSDVWSYGILLWEVYTYGEDPYPQCSLVEIANYLESGCRMTCPNTCSPTIQRIMRLCWERDSHLRPTFGEIVNCLSIPEREPE